MCSSLKDGCDAGGESMDAFDGTGKEVMFLDSMMMGIEGCMWTRKSVENGEMSARVSERR